jgi:hypothetical protein
MFRDKAFELAFEFARQGVVGGAEVGKLGKTTDRRDFARVQQRGPRGKILERAVGMPKAISHREHP